MKPCFTVHQVLHGIVRAIANEWFWINHQPRLSLRSEDISGMKIRGQKPVGQGGSGKLFEDSQSFVNQFRILPEMSLRDGFAGPEFDH